MNISQFDYPLPPELIAQTPIEPRHASRLMVVDCRSGEITHHTFADLVDLLRPGDILVANDSRVIPARLFGRKQSGGSVEILLLKRVDELRWEALVGGKRVRPGVVIEIEAGRRRGGEDTKRRGHEETRTRRGEDAEKVISSPPRLTVSPSHRLIASPFHRLLASVVEDLGDSRRLLEFSQPIDALLAEIGHTPLPPYIHTPLANAERYQTVYSRMEGSAAAPTAGLHFSPEMLLALREKGVLLDYVTLHIGLDTFKPVTVERVESHPIHREYARLTPDTARRINEAKLAGGRLVAVGTTAARTLETAALRSAGYTGSLRHVSAAGVGLEIREAGLKLKVEGSTRFANLQPATISCSWQPVVAIEEETDLFIYPGYTFRVVEALLTNFHLPRSTLLMLVSAFAGTELMRHAYEVAITERYRFYSFGDAMLLWR